MRQFLPAIGWAFAMVVLACGARLGWIERDAALTLLLVIPLLAVTSMRRGGLCCGLKSRGA